MSTSTHDFDYGIDVTLHELTRRRRKVVLTGFRLDIQAKSTVGAHFDAESIKFDLNVKNYDDLRDAHVPVPRILVLLDLPKSEPDWMIQDEEVLVLRKCAYWTSLKGDEPTRNKDSIRITLNRSNVFSADALSEIMECVRQGNDL